MVYFGLECFSVCKINVGNKYYFELEFYIQDLVIFLCISILGEIKFLDF